MRPLLGLAEARRRRRRTRIEGRLRGGWRSLGDAELVARAAVGSFRGHVMANPAWHESTIRLLEDALALLPREDSVQRSQVLAALSLELYFTPQRSGASRSAWRASRWLVESGTTRRSPSRWHVCAHGPLGSGSPRPAPHRRDRAGRSERTPTIPSSRTSATFTARAISSSWLAEDARRSAQAAAETVEDLGQPMQRYYVTWLQSTLALLGGRFDEAQVFADESLEIGIAADNPDALVVWGTQAVILAWQRGEVRHLVEPAQQLLEQFPDLSALPAEVALVEALAGTTRHARSSAPTPPISTCSCSTRSGCRRWSRWSRCAASSTPECARSIYERLAPYAQTLCVVSLNLSDW